MKREFVLLLKYMLVCLLLGVAGFFCLAMGGSNASPVNAQAHSASPQLTAQATPTPQAVAAGLDPTVEAALITAVAAIAVAIFTAIVTLRVPWVQNKIEMRKDKLRQQQEAVRSAEEERQAREAAVRAVEEQRQAQAEAENQRLQKEQALEAKVERYRQSLSQNSGLNQLQMFGRGSPLDTEDVYVRLRVHEDTTLSYALDPALQAAEETHDPDILIGAVHHYLERRIGSSLEPEVALAGHKHRHSVIVGEPGSGKTTLLKYLALRSANRQVASLPDTPIYIELHSLIAAGHTDLVAFAARQWEENYDIPFEEAHTYIHSKMKVGGIILLLDGLDEITIGISTQQAERAYVNAFEAIKKVAERYPLTTIVVTIRKAGYGDQYRPILPGFSELEVLNFQPKEINLFIRNWYNNVYSPPQSVPGKGKDALKEIKIRDLTARLERNQRIQALAANPLLLSLIILVYEENLELPERRAELYARCVEVLLTRWDASRQILRPHPFNAKHKQDLLTEIAWHFHNQGKHYFAYDELRNLIKAFLPSIGLPAEQADDILQEIIRVNGLLKEQAQRVYCFTHLTLQEYFVAQYMVERNMLQQLLQRLGTLWWEEVLQLYASGTHDASPLLRALLGRDPHIPLQEDVFHTNLIRAGFCLSTTRRTGDVPLRQEIIDLLFDTLQSTPYSRVQSQIAMALAQIGSVVANKEDVNKRLLNLLASKQPLDLEVRERISYALGASGDKSLAWDLGNLLRNAEVESYVRVRIALALGALGDRTAEATLLDLLEDEQGDYYVRLGVAQALGFMSDSSSTARLLNFLKRQKKGEESVAHRVAITLGKFGNRQIVPELLSLLQDEQMYNYVRAGIAQALAQLADAQVVQALQQALANEKMDSYVRKQIAVELSNIDSALVPIDPLLLLLQDVELDVEVRGAIASTLCALGEQSAVPALQALLLDTQIAASLQASAARTLGCLGNTDIVPQLRTLLRNPQLDPRVHACVLATLAKLGSREVLPELLTLLEGCTNVKLSEDIWLYIATASGELGTKSILDKPDIARQLVGMLSNQLIERSVRQRIAATLEILGVREVVPDLLPMLVNGKIDRYVRRDIAKVVARLGQGEQIVQQLIVLLKQDSDIQNDIYDALWKTSHHTNVSIIPDGNDLKLVKRS